MKENILSINEYLEHNPNATLKEYHEYINKIQIDEHTRKFKIKPPFYYIKCIFDFFNDIKNLCVMILRAPKYL